MIVKIINRRVKIKAHSVRGVIGVKNLLDMPTLCVFSFAEAKHWAERAAAKLPVFLPRVPEGPHSAQNSE